MSLHVHLLPALTSERELAGRMVVVIDVLRATTTMTHALSAGAAEIIPCLEVEEARQIASGFSGSAVLGGERFGQRITGFGLGNSPLEYSSAAVAGKSIVFTTTNGTRALRQCRLADRVLLGSFLNLSAVVAELHSCADIALLCAGTDGHVTSEDVLCAGAIAAALRSHANIASPMNDEARLASAAWNNWLARGGALVDELHDSRGGANLISLGMHRDIHFAAQIDCTTVVGELHLGDGRVRSTRSSDNVNC